MMLYNIYTRQIQACCTCRVTLYPTADMCRWYTFNVNYVITCHNNTFYCVSYCTILYRITCTHTGRGNVVQRRAVTLHQTADIHRGYSSNVNM